MSTNILVAIKNIINNPLYKIKSYYAGRNRANNVGGALEEYIKDVFASTFNIDDDYSKNNIYNKTFSYLGNQNNPPDIILRNGDSIEVKKIQGSGSGIALNSSYPKSKLYSSSSMITAHCKNCEVWSEKDIIYVIGNTDDDELKTLWFVYGDCYAADKSVYEKIKTTISNGLREIHDIELVETNELGKIKKVDPLGITDLRIRGMWHILHPQKVYEYLPKEKMDSKFKFFCLMKEDKFNKFEENFKIDLENLANEKRDFYIKKVKIKDPNNPANLLNAVFMEYYYE